MLNNFPLPCFSSESSVSPLSGSRYYFCPPLSMSWLKSPRSAFPGFLAATLLKYLHASWGSGATITLFSSPQHSSRFYSHSLSSRPHTSSSCRPEWQEASLCSTPLPIPSILFSFILLLHFSCTPLRLSTTIYIFKILKKLQYFLTLLHLRYNQFIYTTMRSFKLQTVTSTLISSSKPVETLETLWNVSKVN